MESPAAGEIDDRLDRFEQGDDTAAAELAMFFTIVWYGRRGSGWLEDFQRYYESEFYL